MSPIYSICISNYNMGDTLDTCLRSVMCQIDSTFEIVVVDDGSTDNSLKVLESLQLEFPRLRYIPLSRDPRRKLGETRNVSIKAARGTYCILHIDADDIWEHFIPTFTRLFLDIKSRLSFEDFMLSGDQIQIAPKKLLLSNPYLNIYYGEDRCLWSSLAAVGKFISVEHFPMRRRIPLKRTSSKAFKLISSQLSGLICTFSTTSYPFASLLSYYKILFTSIFEHDYSLFLQLTRFLLLPYAFFVGTFVKRYPLINFYRGNAFENCKINLSRLEKDHLNEFGRLNLSNNERKLFFLEDL